LNGDIVMRTLTVRLPVALFVQLDLEAGRLAISRAELIRGTIREKFRETATTLRSHPFSSIIEILESAEPGLAARVDELVYR
jgi:hypothetical protein